MMSNNRGEYASPSAWLSALRQDGLWLSQLQQLKDPNADRNALRESAMRKIGQGLTYEFWDSYRHQVEPVVTEVWEMEELTLPKLKIQAVGMLSMEWIEQQEKTGNAVQPADDESKEIIDQLKPIFYGIENDARDFFNAIQGMKPIQITEKVNQLVAEGKISDISRKRDLWTVLKDHGLYTRSESNWNQQVN
jgi:hypothetical protein